MAEPVFRDLIGSLDESIHGHHKGTNRPEIRLHDSFNPGAKDHCEDALPSDIHLFAIQAGLAHVWRSWGIEPDAVLGVGIGQVTAACVAGCLCFRDAATLITRREVAISAMKSNPKRCQQALEEFEALADGLNYYPPNIQMVDSLDGSLIPVHRSLGGSYWRRHLTEAPSFQSFETFNELDCELILHLGPGAELHEHADDITLGQFRRSLASLDNKQHPTSKMLETLGQLYVAGVNPDFKSFSNGWKRQRLSLPLYPFKKRRYWITDIPQRPEPVAVSAAGR